MEYRTKMIKKKLEEGRVENTATYCRNQRKLALYKVHYAELKANRPAPLSKNCLLFIICLRICVCLIIIFM